MWTVASIQRARKTDHERTPASTDAERGTEVKSQAPAILYVLLMAAVIVAVDVLFFKDRFWERLIVNVGIVLVFVAVYLRFLRRR